MTDTADKILRLYQQTNIRADESLLYVAVINMIRVEQSEIHNAVAELKELGYLQESDERLFLTKKGFEYICSELK
jgi:type III secretory pathway lipoprotein EscJ